MEDNNELYFEIGTSIESILDYLGDDGRYYSKVTFIYPSGIINLQILCEIIDSLDVSYDNVVIDYYNDMNRFTIYISYEKKVSLLKRLVAIGESMYKRRYTEIDENSINKTYNKEYIEREKEIKMWLEDEIDRLKKFVNMI